MDISERDKFKKFGWCGMHFMIDYENVRESGLLGSEYLLPDDKVTLFYSDAANTVENGYMKSIFQSGCGIEICKLIKKGKNALDFYIASRIGEVFGEEYSGIIGIVSKDQGFRAIKDYWARRSASVHTIVIQPTIERCIISANEANDRTESVRNKIKKVDITSAYAKYEEQKKLRNLLEQTMKDSELCCCVDEIQSIMEMGKNRKIIYLDTLRKFGKKDGLEIYRKIREHISKY